VFKGLVSKLERASAPLVTQKLFKVNDYFLLLRLILLVVNLVMPDQLRTLLTCTWIRDLLRLHVEGLQVTLVLLDLFKVLEPILNNDRICTILLLSDLLTLGLPVDLCESVSLLAIKDLSLLLISKPILLKQVRCLVLDKMVRLVEVL